MTRSRPRTVVTAIVAGALLAMPAAPAVVPAPPVAADPPVGPAALPGLDDARQVIVVTAPNARTTFGTLTAYTRHADGAWAIAYGPMTARLGFSGIIQARDRRQGTGKTPAGTFGIVSAFGRQPNPGTSLAYRQVDRNDTWTYNPRVPSTYNMMQTANRSWAGYGRYAEHLWSYGTQYDYVAVLDYNLPRGPIRRGPDGIRRATTPADTAKGGGIFLHVSNGKVTAGCIAIPREQMRQVLTWLDPAKRPRIVIQVR